MVLTSRDPAKGEAAAGRLRDDRLEVRHHQLDVADDDSIGRLADFIRSELGRLDILINSAAIVRGQDEPRERAMRVFEAMSAGLRAVLATNLIGPLLLCQALIPLMQGCGRVVNVSSGMGQLSAMGSNFPAYRISKAGLNALTGIFASELAGTGVKVNAACPGWVRTDMGGRAPPARFRKASRPPYGSRPCRTTVRAAACSATTGQSLVTPRPPGDAEESRARCGFARSRGHRTYAAPALEKPRAVRHDGSLVHVTAGSHCC